MKQILNSIIALSLWLSLAGMHSVALAHEGHHNQAPAKACHEKTVGDDFQYSVNQETEDLNMNQGKG